MKLLDRILGKKSAGNAARAADLASRQDVARRQNLVGQGTVQTQGEQDLTRSRMEDELAGQRKQREDAKPTE